MDWNDKQWHSKIDGVRWNMQGICWNTKLFIILFRWFPWCYHGEIKTVQSSIYNINLSSMGESALMFSPIQIMCENKNIQNIFQQNIKASLPCHDHEGQEVGTMSNLVGLCSLIAQVITLWGERVNTSCTNWQTWKACLYVNRRHVVSPIRSYELIVNANNGLPVDYRVNKWAGVSLQGSLQTIFIAIQS